MKCPPILPTECYCCGRQIFRRKTKSGQNYCNTACKAEWQRTQKPVSEEWLEEHYVTKKMDTTQISKIVHRDPKSVWNWLKDFGIPTRPRGANTSRSSFKKGAVSLFLGRKHKPETIEKLRAIAKADGRVPYHPAVGSYMKGRKGSETPNWKGGVTADRQRVYASMEWAKAVKIVWERDKSTCQKCGIKKTKNNGPGFDIHHIKSFECVALRCESSNLILLCEPCHYWVHSRNNTTSEFICL